MRVTALLLGALGIIAVATLVPGDATLPAPTQCLICGPRGLADALLNLALFAPVGAALALQRVRLSRIALMGLAISATVELLQLLIPGRDASAGDLLFNTVGTVLGAGIPAVLRSWRAAYPERAALMATVCLSAALGIIAVTGRLLEEGLPDRQYFGQWRPLFAHHEQYNGRVLRVHVGDLRVGDGPARQSRELRARLMRGETLQIDAVSGPKPQSKAFVFNIYDDRELEVVSVVADNHDLVFRYRTRGSHIRLDQPTFRFRNALRDVAPNQPWSVRLQLVPGGVCARTAAMTACPLAYSAASGWATLMHIDTVRWVDNLLDAVWLLILFLPAGSYLTRPRNLILGLAVTATGLLAVSYAVDLAPIHPYAVAGAVGGVLLGYIVRRVVSRERIHA